MLRRLLLIATAVWLIPVARAGDEPDAVTNPPAQFPVESLRLLDGRLLKGLVQNENALEIEFAEIVRPAGKPMFAVVRRIEQKEIMRLERLDSAGRQQAQAAFARFRHRAVVEAIQIERIPLARAPADGGTRWLYEGRWFRLSSTADEETTRRVVARLEQLFTAYRQLLPPRLESAEPVAVQLCGSRDEYTDLLRVWGLEIENPAFYSSTHHTIVAGSALEPLARQFAALRRKETEVDTELKRREIDFTQSLRGLTNELRRNAFSDDEIKAEVVSRRAQWDNERKAIKQECDEVRRRNEALFNDASKQLFGRLAHESFHAYLETHVYPPPKYRIPGWLNEGLAQIFETAQIDDKALRIDAPPRERLQALRTELASPQRLSLARIITSEPSAFLKTHDRAAADKLYLYSWGLAWHLVFQQGRLDIGQIDKYLEAQRDVGPVERFERFTDEPLADFEHRWIAAMRNGKNSPP